MKIRFFKIALVAAVALLVELNGYSSQNTEFSSELVLANVKALTDVPRPSDDGDPVPPGTTDCAIYCEKAPGYLCILIYGDGIESITCDQQRPKNHN